MRILLLVAPGVGVAAIALWYAGLDSPVLTPTTSRQMTAHDQNEGRPRDADSQAILDALVADVTVNSDDEGDVSEDNATLSKSEKAEREAEKQEAALHGYMTAMEAIATNGISPVNRLVVDRLVAAGLAELDAERIVRQYAQDALQCFVGNQISLQGFDPMANPCLLNARQKAGLTTKIP